MTTGNMHRKFGEVRQRGFSVIHPNRQTQKPTDKLQYFAALSNNKPSFCQNR